MLRSRASAYSWAKSSKTKHFIMKCWISPVTYCDTVLKVKNRMVVSVVYPCRDHVADRGLCSQLLPSITRVWYHILLAWEKIKMPTLKYSFFWMPVVFTASWCQKIISWTILNWGPSVLVYALFSARCLEQQQEQSTHSVDNLEPMWVWKINSSLCCANK